MNQTPHDGGQKSHPVWASNRGIGIGLSLAIVALLIYLLTSDWTYLRLRDGFYLGAFPVAGAVAMLVCTVILTFDSYRQEVPGALLNWRWNDLLWVAGLLLGAWLLLVVANSTSTLIAGPIFLLVLMYLFGVRPWTVAVIAAALMGGGVYIAFSFLGIELPHGALPF